MSRTVGFRANVSLTWFDRRKRLSRAGAAAVTRCRAAGAVVLFRTLGARYFRGSNFTSTSVFTLAGLPPFTIG